MAIKFQYNKTSMQAMKKQLAVREKALPTLKSKESALRVEVKKIKDKKSNLIKEHEKFVKNQQSIDKYWVEFPEIVSIENVDINIKKIAGVKIPLLNKVDFDVTDYSLFNEKAWFPEGIDRLKKAAQLLVILIL